MFNTPLSNPIGRRLAGLAPLLMALVGLLAVWGGFDIRDETVESPSPRSARLTAAPPEPGNAIEYVEGYEAGRRRAVAENRPMLVVFRATWCHWCAEFARGTLIDRRLVGLSRQFVCVMVDADRHAADCSRFGVKEFPTVVVASSEGNECRRWTGCPSVDELMSAMIDTVPTARIAVAEGDDSPTTR